MNGAPTSRRQAPAGTSCWHNHLPGDLIAADAYRCLTAAQRATLQTIADACTQRLPDGSWIGARGGGELARRAQCSRRTLWRHVHHLEAAGLIVALEVGGCGAGRNDANVYGVPARLGALDDRRAERDCRRMIRGDDGRYRPHRIRRGGQMPLFGDHRAVKCPPPVDDTACQSDTGGCAKLTHPLCQSGTPISVVYPYGSKDHRVLQTHGSGEKKTTQARGRRRLPHLSDENDLRDVHRLMALFDRAVARGLVDDGEADRLRFVAAAEYALRHSTTPLGLFAWMVNGHRWLRITNVDEEAARQRLAAWSADDGSWKEVPVPEGPPPPTAPAAAMSDVAVLEASRRRGVDPYVARKILIEHYGWTGERFAAAWREWVRK